MTIADPVSAILEEIRNQNQGYITAVGEDSFREIIKRLPRYNALTDSAAESIRSIGRPSKRELYTLLFEDILAKVENFKQPAQWALFWSLAAGCHKAIELVHDYEEKELNGYLLGRASSEIEHFRAPLRAAVQSDLNEALLFNYGNLAVKGLEAHTGGDFGLIIEVNTDNRRTIWATLVQAKRAHQVRTGIHRKAGNSDQLEKLKNSGGGMYLFYDARLKPKNQPILSKSAELAASQVEGNTQRLDILELSSEFASRIAFGMVNGAPGARQCESEIDAVKFLFNAKASDDVLGHVAVCILDKQQYSPEARFEARARWKNSVELIRVAQSNVQHSHDRTEEADDHKPREPGD
jgi:hypothetical protein